MTTEEHDMWDGLNIEYENAYRDNPLKKACVENAITLLKPGSRILDVGCGTGVPVSQMLADAGMDVVGIDVAPKMVGHAQRRVKGTFEVSDMVNYKPQGHFDAVFVIYSQLGLTYADFHAATYRIAKTISPGGLLVIGQSPADKKDIASDNPAWDESKSFVEGYNLPFWGEPFATLMFTREGQKQFLVSMGFEIVYDDLGVFQPNNPACHPENQQYVIARRKEGSEMKEPSPFPKKSS